MAKFKCLPGEIWGWNPAYGEIPLGWSLCDGKNNTPNLKDKFVPKCSTDLNLGYEKVLMMKN